MMQQHAVIFEAKTCSGQATAYYAFAQSLRPELENQPGFIDNIRYRSLRREGWYLSLNSWVDENSLVGWRKNERHHEAQQRGRTQFYEDYHLRIGRNVLDAEGFGMSVDEGLSPEGEKPRLGEISREVVTLVNVSFTSMVEGAREGKEEGKTKNDLPKAHETPTTTMKPLARDVSSIIQTLLGFDPAQQTGLVEWDVYQNLTTKDEILLLFTWTDTEAARAFSRSEPGINGIVSRVRQTRVVRDYGMFDRREAPQSFPDVPMRETRH